MPLAAAYAGQRTILVTTAPEAAPNAGEVVVEPAFTGICGTDLHIFHGDMDARVHLPAIIGHEMSGRIARLGPGVTGWQVGDPVTVMPLSWDGTCPACRAGNQHICQNLNFIGIDSTGAMQQRWVVPAGTLVRLPADLPLDLAALVEPTAVAVHDVGRAAVQAGERALVVGGGPVGLLIAQVARIRGASVLMAETNAYRRATAAELGFRVLDPGCDDLAAELDRWTEGAGVPVAFEVSGSAGGLATAVDSLAVRGRLCLVAIHGQPREINLHRFFWRELSLVGARLYVRDDFEQAVRLIASGEVRARALISKTLPLQEAESAFAALAGGENVMKILIDCQSSAIPGAQENERA